MKDRRQIGGRYLARARGAFRGGQARRRLPVNQPADPEADVATGATPARTSGIRRQTGTPDRILGPPWALSAAGGMVPKGLYLVALNQVVTQGVHSGGHADE